MANDFFGSEESPTIVHTSSEGCRVPLGVLELPLPFEDVTRSVLVHPSCTTKIPHKELPIPGNDMKTIPGRTGKAEPCLLFPCREMLW